MAMSETERTILTAEQGASPGLALLLATIPAAVTLVVLGILALSGVYPLLLVSVAVMVGGALLTADSLSAARQLATVVAAKIGHHLNVSQMSGGLNAGVLGGVTGFVLGILAILGIAAQALVPIAVIVFGTALLFDYVARSQTRALRMTTGETPEQSASIALAAASSTDTGAVLTGVALVALGIIALVGVANEVLTATAFLSLGVYMLLEEASVSGRMLSLLGL